MKVAVLSDYPLDPHYLRGGVEAVVRNLVEKLSGIAGLELHVVALREIKTFRRVTSGHNLVVYYVPAAYRFANITFFLINKLRLLKVLHSIQPDVVHAHIAGTYAEVSQLFGRPAVLTVHGIRHRAPWLQSGWLNRYVRRPLIAREERASVRGARHLISISPYVEQEFGSLIRGRVYAIENPVRDEFFQLADETVPGRILFAGHVDRNKSPHLLVQALPAVRAVFPDAHIHVAGAPYEEDYWQELQADLKRLSLCDHVRFLGALPEERLLQEYAQCALLALPSRQETAPMVIQQAMAASKPVVGSRVGGIPYLITPGETGYLVDYGDVDGLAHALLQLLMDDERRLRFGAQAREAAATRFGAMQVAQRTFAVYQSIVHDQVT